MGLHQADSSEDGVRRPTSGEFIENGRTRNPLTLWTVHINMYWVTLKSVQLRNATTTARPIKNPQKDASLNLFLNIRSNFISRDTIVPGLFRRTRQHAHTEIVAQ